jgi:uncharacterized protein YecT (DUF1311 family)
VVALVENPELVKLLIKSGADVAARNDEGYSAADRALEYGATENLEVIKEGGGVPFAPSFDCTKASKEREKAVCSSKKLADADVELNAVYKKVRSSLPKKEQILLLKEQLRWLREVDFLSDKSLYKYDYETEYKNAMLKKFKERIVVLSARSGDHTAVPDAVLDETATTDTYELAHVNGTYVVTHKVGYPCSEEERIAGGFEDFCETTAEDKLTTLMADIEDLDFTLSLSFFNFHECYLDGTADYVSSMKWHYSSDHDGTAPAEETCEVDILATETAIEFHSASEGCANFCGHHGSIEGATFPLSSIVFGHNL